MSYIRKNYAFDTPECVSTPVELVNAYWTAKTSQEKANAVHSRWQWRVRMATVQVTEFQERLKGHSDSSEWGMGWKALLEWYLQEWNAFLDESHEGLIRFGQ